AKWKANPHLENVDLKVEADDVDESFDAEDLAEIFSGREAAERAADEKREREEEAREKLEAAQRKDRYGPAHAANIAMRAEQHDERDSQATKFGAAFVAVIVAFGVGVVLFERHKKQADEDHDK